MNDDKWEQLRDTFRKMDAFVSAVQAGYPMPQSAEQPDKPIYLGRRVCPACKMHRRMMYHEEEQAIRCDSCGREMHARASRLTTFEQACLRAFREVYSNRNGLDLAERRDKGLRANT